MLDARGAVGVTERATCFAAMRGLARRIARAPPPALVEIPAAMLHHTASMSCKADSTHSVEALERNACCVD